MPNVCGADFAILETFELEVYHALVRVGDEGVFVNHPLTWYHPLSSS